MKILRRLPIVFGLAALLLLLLVGAAFLPWVQRRAVLKVLADQPGLKAGVGYVAIRPGSVVLRNLSVENADMRVTLADARIELSLWEAVAQGRVHVHDAAIAGLKIDLTPRPPSGTPVQSKPVAAQQPEEAVAHESALGGSPMTGSVRSAPVAEAAPPPSFEGVFKYLQFDREVVLDTCRIGAEVVYPQAADQPPGAIRLNVTGGKFGPGREARFDFEAQAVNPAPDASIAMVEIRGALTLVLNTEGAFERVAVQAAAEARGPVLSAPAALQAGMVLARTATGEKYTAALNSIEDGRETRLIALDCEYVAGGSRLDGAWDVRVEDRQLTPFLLGLAAPQFHVTGEGRFEFNPAAPAGRLNGRLAWDSSRLEAIDPRLRDIGALHTKTTFDFEYEGGRMRVSELTVDISGPKPLLALRTVQPYTVNLATLGIAAADPQKELLRVKIEGVPVAWARPFLPDFEVEGEEMQGEFAVALREERIWLRTTEPVRVSGLAIKSADRILLPASELKIETEVEGTQEEVRVRLAGFTLQTAAGDRIEGRGETTMKFGATPSVSALAGFEAKLPALLASTLPGLGPLEARGEVALTQTGDNIQIDRLDTRVLAGDDRPLLELSLREPFRFGTAWGRAAPPGGGAADQPGEVLKIKLARLPLSLLQPWLGDLALEGEVAPGEISVRSGGQDLHIAVVAPLRVGKFFAAAGGRPLLQNLTVEIDPSIDWSARGLTVKLSQLQMLDAAGAALLTGRAGANFGPDFSHPTGEGSVDFDVSVSAMASQPILAGYAPPGQGRLSGEAKFAINRDVRSEGRLTLNGLVSPTTGKPLPVVNFSFRAGLGADGILAVKAPLLIDRSGERSDLTVEATVRPNGETRLVDARIAGEHFVADDVLELVRAFTARAASTAPAPSPRPAKAGDLPPESREIGADRPAPPPPVSPPPAARPPATRPGKAAWAGLAGQVVLDVKSLVYGGDFEVTGLSGRVAIDPQRIAAEKIAGRLGSEGELALDAEVRFSANAARPYTSKLDLTLREFEIGSLFKALSPDEPPTIEGRFNVRSEAVGAGGNLPDLLQHTRGDFTLQSRKGVSRLLQQQATQLSRTARIVGGVTSILGAVGVVDANKAESIARGSDVAAELGTLLAELPYDQLNVRLSRDESFNVKISDFTLVSPIVRLQGDGLVSYDRNRSLLDQALQVRMNMGVMGSAEKALARAKSPLLSGERDDLGYMKLSEPFVIGGTLDKPDPGQLYSMLGRSVLDRLLR